MEITKVSQEDYLDDKLQPIHRAKTHVQRIPTRKTSEDPGEEIQGAQLWVVVKFLPSGFGFSKVATTDLDFFFFQEESSHQLCVLIFTVVLFVNRNYFGYLPSIAFGAFIHHPWVWNIGTKLEIHTPALGASAGCLNDSWHDAKHGHVLYILTLKLPTQSIPTRQDRRNTVNIRCIQGAQKRSSYVHM